MYTIRKMYKVEYAHQLVGSFTKCCHETIHGHSGVVELFFSSEKLNEHNMVVDFGEISSIIKKYIMDLFDHALFMSNTMDKRYLDTLAEFNEKLTIVDENPTAEYFAHLMFIQINELLSKKLASINGYTLIKVRFHETDTGYAEYYES